MKERLDQLLVKRGLCESRSRARALILAGKVTVGGRRVDKAGCQVPEEETITLKEGLPYVSRGGLKLEKAIKEFGLDVRGKVILDGGASTGGFTDCLLQQGAQTVYAVDVGYGQLAWDLRNDPRVINLERTNLRHLTREALGELPGMATLDLSFISLKLVIPPLKALGVREIVALVKPQFEAGREKVGKRGVVKDPYIHREVLEGLIKKAREEGYSLQGLTYSPVKGPEGNIEYLAYFRVQPGPGGGTVPGGGSPVDKVVEKAWDELS